MKPRDFRAAFFFCGLGAGALGFVRALGKLGNDSARFVSVGAFDNDPLRNSAGARLCFDVLGFKHAAEYLRAFDRCDLCGTVWRLPDARKRAAELAAGDRPLVLLGAKVCQAFGVTFEPFTRTTLPWRERGRRGLAAVILPHPSGRCRIWGQPAAATRARALVRQLRGDA